MTHAYRGLVFLCLMLLAGVSAAASGPMGVVQDTADKVLTRINSEREHLHAEPTKLYNLVEELVVPNFDFQRMAQWVLGRNWSGATAEERAAFTEQFRVLLVRTYAKALLEYTNQPINYLSEQPDADGRTVMVRTELVQPGQKPMDINYRMRQRDGQWKVVDVLVGGVSLIATYRGEFAAKVRESGVSGLIATLTERNAARVQ